MIALEGIDAADPRPDDHPNPIGILLSDGQPGILDGHDTRTQSVLDEDIHFFDFFPLDVIFRIEILDLACHLHGAFRRIEGPDPIDPRGAFANGLPGFLNAGAEWRDEP